MMKKMQMQILRLLVTVIVMGTMAAMIFSLRDDVATLRWELALARQSDGPGLFETIRNRTSIRRFDPSVEISDEAIEKILRAGMCAPTAMNKQPWELIVIRDMQTLKTLAAGVPYSRIENGARAAIVVCGNLDNGLPGIGKELWVQDCCAVTMNILLAVKALNLGAVWVGIYPSEERIAVLRKTLQIPDGYMPLSIVPIGAPAENPPPKDKWNPAKVHAEKW